MPGSCGGGRHRTILCAIALTSLGGPACYRVPAGQKAVADVSIEGTHDIDDEELTGRLATREGSRLFNVFEGVYPYETFDPYALRRDLQRIERHLRARGYYDARVRAARVREKGSRVFVRLEIDQGEPVLVDSINFVENDTVDERTREATRRRVASVLRIGATFDEDKFEEAEAAALRGFTATGHAHAKVSRSAEVDLVKRRARLVFTIDPGPLASFGPVTFRGLGELPEAAVRRVFAVEEGARYSSEELDAGRQALLDLGVFASVDLLEDKEGGGSVIPVTVRTEPSKIRAVLTGGGIELDSLKADLHVQGVWQHANFLGGLRKFDVRYKPGIVFYPTRLPTLKPPTDYLYEHRLQANLRQPAFVEKRTTGLLRAEYSVYPALLGKPTEDVLGYHELRGEVGVERTVLKRLFVRPTYDFQANFPFAYLGRIDGVDTLIISSVGLKASLDFRNDPIKPRRGFFVGSDLQVSGGPLGGDARDVRVQPEVRAFLPLPRRLTLAWRGSVGFLFAQNYTQLSNINFENPGPSRVDASRDYQLLFFRGFFSGGPSSNRGYPLRGVAPHDNISYLSPAGQSAAAGACNPNSPDCQLPIGGLSLWETSVELRYGATDELTLATFCDASDVSPLALSIRPDHPHLSCGAGARYDTPVGPLRLDVGYRIPGLQFPANDRFEQAPPELLGAPIAIAFGIGEAF